MDQSALLSVPPISQKIGGLILDTAGWIMPKWAGWIGSERTSWSMTTAEIPKDSTDRCLPNVSRTNSKHNDGREVERFSLSFLLRFVPSVSVTILVILFLFTRNGITLFCVLQFMCFNKTLFTCPHFVINIICWIILLQSSPRWSECPRVWK